MYPQLSWSPFSSATVSLSVNPLLHAHFKVNTRNATDWLVGGTSARDTDTQRVCATDIQRQGQKKRERGEQTDIDSEAETERERDRHRQTDRQTHRLTHRLRQTETVRQRERERERDRHTD